MAQALWRAAVLGAAALFTGESALAQAPACGKEMKNARRAESARYTVAYRMVPAKIEVSKHFSLELAVCAKTGAPDPDALRIGALMPEHGHGMNYKPTVIPLGGGRFHADGLMFHMPGRWQFEFEVDSGKNTEQVLHDFMLR
jgi:hypothetical protein